MKPTKEDLKAKAYDLIVKRAEIENELAQVNQAIANYKEEK
jgi:hypothetical protein